MYHFPGHPICLRLLMQDKINIHPTLLALVYCNRISSNVKHTVFNISRFSIILFKNSYN